MATILTITSNPQVFTVGNWPSALNTAKWALPFTFTNASSTTRFEWGALLGQATGGLWITTGNTVDLYDTSDALVISQAITWAAGATVTFTVDPVALTFQIAGAATGNGTFSISNAGPYFNTAANLKAGGIDGISGYAIAGTFGNVVDFGVTTHARAVGVSAAADLEAAGTRTSNRAVGVSGAAAISVSGSRVHARTVAVAAAAALAISGQVSSVATHDRTVGVAAAADLEVAATRTHNRSSGVAGAADLEVAAKRVHNRSVGVAAASDLEVAGQLGTGFRRGSYDAGRVIYGTPAGTVSVTISTPASGSTILVAVGGNLGDLATSITDSHSNTWTAVGTDEYSRWAGYGVKLYRCIGATGGSSHVFSQQFGQTLGFDEASIAVVCIEQAAYIADSSLVERASATSHATPSVTAQDACEWVVFYSGDAPTGATSVLTPSNGLTILDDSTGVDDPNGYVPLVILGATKSAGAQTSTIGISPTQGAIIGAFAVQEANTIGRSVGVSGAAALAISGQRVHNRAVGVAGASDLEASGSTTRQRAASFVGTAAVAISGLPTRQRAVGVAGAADLEVAGTRAHNRAAAVIGVPALAMAGQVTRERSVGVSGAADLEIAAQRVHARAVAVAGAVDLESSGLVLPPGAVQHERAAAVTGAAALAVSALVTHGRQVAVSGAVALAAAGQTTHGRSVALAGAVSLAAVGAVGSATAGTTIAAIRDAIIARIESLVPDVDTRDRWVVHDDAEPIREWAERVPSACLRRFSVVPRYDTTAPVVSSVTLERVTTTIDVVVCYPRSDRWRSARGRNDVIDSDRRRLEYEVGTSSRSGAGFDAPAVLISRSLDQLEDGIAVVFATVTIDATYWRTSP